MANAYDTVAYPSSVYPRTHPDNLAAIAILLGLEAAPVEHCRVLELACGDGFNLISMAHQLPGSQFVGIDLAADPIGRGRAIIETLGLKNIVLQTRDITAVDAAAELGEFDYIIAHGFYSWVPAPVREKLMALCGQCLGAQGIAYLSYNAYPGNHIRDITRGMMRYHVANFPEPKQQLAQARGILKVAAGAGESTSLYHRVLLTEDERIGSVGNGHFFHDDLNSDNQPFYFHEFMDHAHQHGLRFLSEADIADKQEEAQFPAQVLNALAQLDPDDVVMGEQYRDFFRGRAFRRTLLCRQETPVQRDFDASHLAGLFVAGEIRAEEGTPEGEPEGTQAFQGPGSLRLKTNEPLVKAALHRIGGAWPAFLAFPELVVQVQQDMEAAAEERVLTIDVADTEGIAADLAETILRMAVSGGLELRGRAPRFALEPGPRPKASALARLQIEHGPRLSTLLHGMVQIDDAFSQNFLRLLDGTRDRHELRAALERTPRAGDGGTSDPAASAPPATEQEIDAVLRRLARLGLLEA